jgi:hypothetical protein
LPGKQAEASGKFSFNQEGKTAFGFLGPEAILTMAE